MRKVRKAILVCIVFFIIIQGRTSCAEFSYKLLARRVDVPLRQLKIEALKGFCLVATIYSFALLVGNIFFGSPKRSAAYQIFWSFIILFIAYFFFIPATMVEPHPIMRTESYGAAWGVKTLTPLFILLAIYLAIRKTWKTGNAPAKASVMHK